ncbi:GDP-L-fucose synthase [Phycicoccus sp. Soil748]|uniref:GDP-L-fucose synthase family protein n=1 Tax=Phycicoccus sp. Soil748 TaxID=1736397 RepID=UPI000702AAE9|nr:GDP-L-fucose synthase [Phycicoccus sp. Soil748]KRE57158.1 GDP-fucose synthetase [Phycicoccus sp. Soil748]
MAVETLDRSAPFYVAGHRGLAGGAVWRHLQDQGFDHLLGRSSTELDLRDRDAVFEFLRRERPRYVVMAAARVGGIGANSTHPVEFLSDNLQMQTNVLDAAHEIGVERLLFLGSSCIYPKFAEQPIKESSLLTGALEPTNDAYAIAKIAGVMHVQAMRREYGHRWISAMPTNLYGPGDNYDPSSSHVLAALIRRFAEAVRDQAPSVTNWGTGTPRREFLHVSDLASAVLHLMQTYDDPSPINVGTGSDLSIKELSDLVAQVSGFGGTVEWDESKPDGTPRKVLDGSRLAGLGWRARVGLSEGLSETYSAYVEGAPAAC